jgi:protein phosphatase methylesterase 1
MDPVPWTTYFERELYLHSLTTPELTHHAYLTSPVGNGPLFVTHHGAGSSGLSFAVLSTEIRKQLPNAGVLSIDARAHGLTSTPSNAPLDLSLQTLASDLLSVLQLTQNTMSWPTIPPIVLVGHSLGGAVVTHLATTHPPDLTLLGYAVLDVVEGSAMDALQSMQTYLSTRPTGFASVQAGIEWHVRSRTVKNGMSARVSVPALLVESGKAQEKEEKDDSAVEEEVGAVKGGQQEKQTQAQKPWRWRTDLAATQPFWEDWFTGLSRKFLSGKAGKLLLLAGTDRLDTELTIGQMQGESDGDTCFVRWPSADSRIQASTHCKSSLRLATSYRRTCQRRRRQCWLTSTSATTHRHWYCHLKYPSCSQREERFNFYQELI